MYQDKESSKLPSMHHSYMGHVAQAFAMTDALFGGEPNRGFVSEKVANRVKKNRKAQKAARKKNRR
jgi:hypothetical protein